jgi:hypothetical protein
MTLLANRRTPRKKNHTSNCIDADSQDSYDALDHHEVRLLSLEFH